MGINGGRGIVGSGSVLGGSGISLSGGGGFTGLLDEYGGAAAAYSVRRLSSTYEGELIEVRRSSDNTTQDIGYDNNGDLDTASLLSFVGVGDGFVRTWYDQSGNAANLQQTTVSNQPQIVTSGSVELLNSKPVLKSFNGAYLETLTNPVSDGYISVFALNKNNATAARNPIIDLATNFSFGSSAGVRMDRNNNYRWGTDNSFITTTTDTVRRLFTGIRGVTNRYFYSNSSLIGSNSVTGTQSFTGVSSLVNGAYFNGTLSADQYFQEITIYNSDQFTNRTGIETNINSYFSIY